MANVIDILVHANAGQAQRELRGIGNEAKMMGGQMSASGTRAAGSLNAMKGALTGFIAAGAGTALLGMAEDAAVAADSVATIERVFKDSADIISAAADQAASRWGLAETEFRQTAGRFGASLQAMGFEADEAAEKTVELTDRAADMAVGFGTTETAANAIAALMRGERDPIEQFGVAIKQVDINARVAAMGLSTLTAEDKKLSEAQAGLALLMEQTADRAGAFGESATKDMAEFRAEVEDLKIALGEELLPAAQSAAAALSEIVGPAQSAAGAIRQVVDVIELIPGLDISPMGILKDTALNMAGPFGAAARAVSWFRSSSDDAADAATGLAGASSEARHSLGTAGGTAGAAASSISGFEARTRAAAAAARAAAGDVVSFANAMASASTSSFGVQRAQIDVRGAIARVNDLMNGQTSAGGGAASSARDLTAATEQLTDAQEDLSDAEQAVADARNELNKIVTGQGPSDDARGAEEDLERAKLDVQEAVLDQTEAEEELAAVRADTESSAADVERAELRLARAENRLEDAVEAGSAAWGHLTQILHGAAETSDIAKEAQDDLAEAEDRLEQAQRRVIDAQEALTTDIGGGGGAARGAAVDMDLLKDAMFDAIDVMSDAALEIAGVKDEGDLTKATFELWKDKIDELAASIAPDSPLRRYLNEYIDQVARLAGMRRLAPVGIDPDQPYVPSGDERFGPVGHTGISTILARPGSAGEGWIRAQAGETLLRRGEPAMAAAGAGGGTTTLQLTVPITLDGRLVATGVAEADIASGGRIFRHLQE